MRRSQKSQFDYHSYRGRTTLTDWLKRIALILALLVLAAVAALFVLQPFTSYTDGGLQWDLPFFSRQEPESSASGNYTIVEGDPNAQPDASQEEPAPPAAPETASSLLSVPLSALLDGSAAQLAREAGADGVTVTVKDDAGALAWQSEQPLAAQTMEGVPEDSAAALTQWNQGDVYTAARLSCFRDEALGSSMDYTLRTSSDYRWQDGEGAHWTTPSNPAVQEYLIGLMTELAQMGFDEIVLEHWGYPTQADGSLSNLKTGEDNYPAGALAPVISHFLAQAAQALEPYGTKLSLAGEADVLAGSGAEPCLTADAVNAHVDRLWVPGDRSQVLSVLEAAGVENAGERTVSLAEALDPSSQAPQAVWNE